MENPATWGKAERIIDQVLYEVERQDPELCGASLPRRIADALKEAGLLVDPHDFWPPI